MKTAAWKLLLFLCPAVFAGQLLAEGDHETIVPTFPHYAPPALTVMTPRARGEIVARPSFGGPNYSALGSSCEAEVRTTAVADGMFQLALNTPCFRHMKVDVFWSNLQVSFVTSATGSLDVTLPAFEVETDIRLMFENGTEIATNILQEDSSKFRRVALNWKNDQGFALHAYEFGAGSNLSDSNGAGRARLPERGSLVVLGDARALNAGLAEIYSIHKVQDRVGRVRLNVEVPVNRENCGTSLMANTIQMTADGGMGVLPLSVLLPDCDTNAEHLVLKNPLRDLAFVRD